MDMRFWHISLSNHFFKFCLSDANVGCCFLQRPATGWICTNMQFPTLIIIATHFKIDMNSLGDDHNIHENVRYVEIKNIVIVIFYILCDMVQQQNRAAGSEVDGSLRRVPCFGETGSDQLVDSGFFFARRALAPIRWFAIRLSENVVSKTRALASVRARCAARCEKAPIWSINAYWSDRGLSCANDSLRFHRRLSFEAGAKDSLRFSIEIKSLITPLHPRRLRPPIRSPNLSIGFQF